MSLTIKAATAMHFAGVAYAAGDTIDTAGMNDRSIAVLLKHQPVYVSAASSAPGTTVLHAFPFAFDTAGLAAGVDAYTPAAGEILLNAWIEVDVGWNGTTPKGDYGDKSVASGHGLAWQSNNFLDMAQPDEGSASAFWAGDANPYLIGPTAGEAHQSLQQNTTGTALSQRIVPFKFIDNTPISVWVSQTGLAGGADPGATQGEAVLYVLTAGPF